MNTIGVQSALQAISDIINLDLRPYFDGIGTDYVPEPVIVTIDWLSYFKLDTFNTDYVTANVENLKAWLNNYVNYFAIYNDTTAWGRLKLFSDVLDYFFKSTLVALLPYTEMTITAYNATTMSGKVFILSYKPYSSAGSSPSLYWELRRRSNNTVLCHVLYDSHSNQFNAVNQLIDKVSLGNYYSGSNTFAYETDSSVRFINV